MLGLAAGMILNFTVVDVDTAAGDVDVVDVSSR